MSVEMDGLSAAMARVQARGAAALVDGTWIKAEALCLYYDPHEEGIRPRNIVVCVSEPDAEFAAQFPKPELLG